MMESDVKGSSVMDYVTLNNGVGMPKLGFGTYQILKEETEQIM